jgi:hypothetical protein
MKKIGIFSDFVDDVFYQTFPHIVVNVVMTEKYDGFFIDWSPKNYNEERFLTQCALIELHKNTVPIVIFDRFMSLTAHEVKWLNKYMNVFLFEPAIHCRDGFKYLPAWVTDFSVLKNNGDREINLIMFSMNRDLSEKDFKNANYILVDYTPDYKIGHLDKKIFQAMNNGCVPILSVGHKYFHALFNGLIVKNSNDMEYYTNKYHIVNVSIIEEIFSNLKSYYPEFLIQNAISQIAGCYE